MTNPIPPGYPGVIAYLSLRDADKAIAFYIEALGAKEIYRLPMPDGRIGHVELQLGSGRLMAASEFPERGNKSPSTLGGSAVTLSLYTEDVDALAARFVNAGGKMLEPVTMQFYGDKSGQFLDPEGYKWNLMEHVEDVSPEEMMNRMAKMTG